MPWDNAFNGYLQVKSDMPVLLTAPNTQMMKRLMKKEMKRATAVGMGKYIPTCHFNRD